LAPDVKSGQVQRSRDGYYPRHPGIPHYSQSHVTIRFLFPDLCHRFPEWLKNPYSLKLFLIQRGDQQQFVSEFQGGVLPVFSQIGRAKRTEPESNQRWKFLKAHSHLLALSESSMVQLNNEIFNL
jgi:hypothetical protein